VIELASRFSVEKRWYCYTVLLWFPHQNLNQWH